MELEQPYVQISKRDVGGTTHYELFTITYFNDTRYKADGSGTVPEEPDADGVFRLSLDVTKDTNKPNLNLVNPVVHWVDIGAILDATNPLIEIEVKEGAASKGKKVVHKEYADEHSRPGAPMF